VAGSDGRQKVVTQAQSLYKVFDAIERPPPLATSDSDHSGAEADGVQVREFPVTTMRKPIRRRYRALW
jgi:hypothetical protein